MLWGVFSLSLWFHTSSFSFLPRDPHWGELGVSYATFCLESNHSVSMSGKDRIWKRYLEA